MDVRFEDILPTPRHGKPVEINAYWYNALNIVSALAEALNISVDHKKYRALAVKVKDSFIRVRHGYDLPRIKKRLFCASLECW